MSPSVSCPCVDALHISTRGSKLPRSPTVSRRLSMPTTRLSTLPNHHPKVKDPAMASVGEAAMAKRSDDATLRRVSTGIVAFVDLRLGAAAVEPALVALKEQVR